MDSKGTDSQGIKVWYPKQDGARIEVESVIPISPTHLHYLSRTEPHALVELAHH